MAEVYFDTSEIRGFAQALRQETDQVLRRIDAATKRRTEAAAEDARNRAPRERPWLSTDAGIEVIVSGRVGATYQGLIRTGKDPRGQYVGLHTEYGTENQPPRPFLGPAAAAQADRLAADIARIIASS